MKKANGDAMRSEYDFSGGVRGKYLPRFAKGANVLVLESDTVKEFPSKQARKYTTSLAGEFLVAGELLRRGIMAAVTYGNAKKADVIALYESKVAVIEVKSTSQPKWVVGSELPAQNSIVWVLVHLPEDEFASPEYFVLTGTELHALLLPQHDAFNARYREKHGKEYAQKGVVSIHRKLLEDKDKGAWHKVAQAVGHPSYNVLKTDAR